MYFISPLRRCIHKITATIILGGKVAAYSVFAQDVFPQPDPSELGLLLPIATPVPGVDRRVLFLGNNEKLTVARVYVEVGDRFVILLPNGQMVAVKKSAVVLTDRPFEPVSKKELARELSERFPGFRTRMTKRYVYVYNASETFTTATSRILETMYPGLVSYCKRRKLPASTPEFPLVVVMFRTEQEFHQYRTMGSGVTAYYNTVSNHVVLYEQSDITRIAPELAVKQSISTIAHEGVHQILHNIGVQQRLSRWPRWISEGIAEYFAPTEVGRRVRWKGAGLPNDLRMHELSQFYRDHDVKTRRKILKTTITSDNLSSLGYASSWALVHFLAKTRSEQFFEFLRAVSQSRPLEPSNDHAELFAFHFQMKYEELDNQLVAHLARTPYVDPVANQTHYVIMFRASGKREAVVTASPAEVRRFRAKSLRNRVHFELHAFPNRIAAERFTQIWLNGG